MDNQYTLRFGSKEKVRQESIDNSTILVNESGYIMASSHNVQPITPLEDILAMYKAGHEYSKY